MNRSPFSGLAALLLAALLAARVWAASSPPVFILQPSPAPDGAQRGFFDYRATPGEVIEDAVLLTNLGDAPLTLVVFASDVQTAENSGLVFTTNWGERPRETGAWIALQASQVALAAGETRRVDFVLHVPTDVSGEFMAGVVAQPTEEPQGEGAYQVRLVQRAAVAVRVRVAGDRPLTPHLRLDALRLEQAGEEQTLAVLLANDGRRGVKGEGRVTLYDQDGDPLRTADFQLGYTLPGAQVVIAVPLVPPVTPGTYPVEVTVSGPDLPSFAAQGTLVVAGPPKSAPLTLPGASSVSSSQAPRTLLLWGVIGLLLLVVVVQAWWLYRRK